MNKKKYRYESYSYDGIINKHRKIASDYFLEDVKLNGNMLELHYSINKSIEYITVEFNISELTENGQK